MHRKLLAGALGAAALAFASSASAVIWTSDLEYRDIKPDGPTKQSPFGTVTIEDGLDLGTTVKVVVKLADVNSLFVNTGGKHDPFLYNLLSPAAVTVDNAAGQNFYDGGRTSPAGFEATPFGKFTNKIGCCSTWVPEQSVKSGSHDELQLTGYDKKNKPIYKKVKVDDYTTVPAHWDENNGSSNGIKGPLEFYVHDDAGLTFAGVGATYDLITGKLTGTGTGNHFFSNSGGWWFTADICDAKAPTSACTYNVAAKDAFRELPPPPPVPEPASWALMILGFGGAGAMLRRRRHAVA